MHMLMMTLLGFAVLAAGLGIGAMTGAGSAKAARLFIPVWAVGALVNGAVGVARAGIPVLTEIGVFVVVFGLPAALAWWLQRRHG